MSTMRSVPAPAASCSRTHPRRTWCRRSGWWPPAAALLDPAVTRRVIEEFARNPATGPVPPEVNRLTDRELEVLHLVARRPVQRRDRRDPGRQRGHRQNPRRTAAGQARATRPRPSRRLRLRAGTGPPGGELMGWAGGWRRALRRCRAAYMAFDGVRALVVGSYITPRSGEHAGQLGPWARVVRAVGIPPESTGMKAAFVVLGAGLSGRGGGVGRRSRVGTVAGDRPRRRHALVSRPRDGDQRGGARAAARASG